MKAKAKSYRPNARLKTQSVPKSYHTHRYKPIKRHEIKHVKPYATVYKPRPGENPVRPAKPPKPEKYKRLFFLRPPAPVPKAPFKHKYKKERHIDPIIVLMWIAAAGLGGLAAWLICELI